MQVETGDYTRQLCFYNQSNYSRFVYGETVYKYVLIPKISNSEFIRRYRYRDPDNYNRNILSLKLKDGVVKIESSEEINKNRVIFDYNIMYDRETIWQNTDYILYRYTLDNDSILEMFRISYPRFLEIYHEATNKKTNRSINFFFIIPGSSKTQFVIRNGIVFKVWTTIPEYKYLNEHMIDFFNDDHDFPDATDLLHYFSVNRSKVKIYLLPWDNHKRQNKTILL